MSKRPVILVNGINTPARSITEAVVSYAKGLGFCPGDRLTVVTACEGDLKNSGSYVVISPSEETYGVSRVR